LVYNCLHESHDEGGFGIPNNTITRLVASYTTNRFFCLPGHLACPAPQVWLPGNDLQDSATWDAPPICQLKRMHEDLLQNYDCTDRPAAAQPAPPSGAGGGAAANVGEKPQSQHPGSQDKGNLCMDFDGDHTATCTAHSGATKAHDWMVSVLCPLFRVAGHTVRTQQAVTAVGPARANGAATWKSATTYETKRAAGAWSSTSASPMTVIGVAATPCKWALATPAGHGRASVYTLTLQRSAKSIALVNHALTR
jgi:hypothetical protein